MRLLICLGLLSLTALAACNPTFNWREVRVADTRLAVLLPCKPDTAVRPVELGTKLGTAHVDLHLQACEAGAATFAIAYMNAPGDSAAPATAAIPMPALLSTWQEASLATLHATAPQILSMRVAGALEQPFPQKVTALGQRADGSHVESQAVYFVQGQQLFQAVILADHINTDVAETFFSGLKLQ